MKGLDGWVERKSGAGNFLPSDGRKQARIEDLGKVVRRVNDSGCVVPPSDASRGGQVSLSRVKLIATLINEEGMSDETTAEYLQELRRTFIGYETLSITKIGRAVASLVGRSEDKRVRALGGALLATWKETARRGLERRRRIAKKGAWRSVKIDHMKEVQALREKGQGGGAAAAALPPASSVDAAGGGAVGKRPDKRTWLHPAPRSCGGDGEDELESD